MRRRCPIFLMTDITDSGAVSLAMVMAYWGLRFPIGRLRGECGSARDGSRIDRMVKVAELHGFEARLVEAGDPQDLLPLDVPKIIFWEFNRYVVLAGRSRRGWVVHDPASGRCVLNDRAFSDGFTGLVLELKPGPGFRRGGRIRTTTELILQLVRSAKPDCIYIAGIGILLVPCGLIAVGLNKVFLDGYYTEGYFEWGAPVITIAVLSILVVLVLGALRIVVISDTCRRINIENVGGFLRKLFTLPASFFVSGLPGEISNRVIALERAGAFVMNRFALTLTDMAGLVFFGSLLFLYDVTLASVAVGGAGLTMVLLFLLFRQQIDDKRAAEVLDGQSDGVVTDSLANIESLKASANEDDALGIWRSKFYRSLRIHYARFPYKATLLSLPVVATTLTISAVTAFGGYRILDGTLTIGSFIVFQLLLSCFFRPLIEFASMLDELQTNDAGLRRVQDVMDYSRDVMTLPPAGSNTPTETRLAGRVEFHNVTFSYSPASEPILSDISFTVEPGRSIAIVGASGSGKSTIARLLAGQYVPTSGTLLIDGKPRQKWTRWQLRRDFAMVDQNIHFFPGSIRENLALFDESIPLADVQKAANDAAIYDQIVHRTGGFEARMTGELGGFSGGERQRMEIARALATNPRIILLDEATSALDTVSEKRVMENISRRGITRVIIAHRLSTIRDADEIIVLARGKIAERGTHDELLARGGLYAALSMEKNR